MKQNPKQKPSLFLTMIDADMSREWEKYTDHWPDPERVLPLYNRYKKCWNEFWRPIFFLPFFSISILSLTFAGHVWWAHSRLVFQSMLVIVRGRLCPVSQHMCLTIALSVYPGLLGSRARLSPNPVFGRPGKYSVTSSPPRFKAWMVYKWSIYTCGLAHEG